MKNQIDALFSQEMSRKEFLQQIGAGLLVLFGVSSLLKTLAGIGADGRPQTRGYGFSAYGGHKK